ncbi:hypothetical protein AAF712_003699 [Marasmius tenuissimus]|uniref:F-box domain-containing protein n=1 Tax=Marasmius tenuissimus TaxID=585030 RepID=A0ABR3A7K3_9AGAR
MGASTSSLAPSFHPSSTSSIKTKSNASAPSQRTMISQTTASFQQQHHVRFISKNPTGIREGTSKHKPILIPQHSSADRESYPSVKSRKTCPTISPSPDERPFSRSKPQAQAQVPSAMPSSQVYPSPHTPRRSIPSALNGSEKQIKPSVSSQTPAHTLPRRALGLTSDSTRHSGKPSSATINRNPSDRVASVSLSGAPNVNVASHKRSQNQSNATRTVMKSPSRSTVGSSSKMSSSSGALSSREGPLVSSHKSPSSPRSHHSLQDSTGFVKRKGTGDDMKREVLKPIHEVEAGDFVGIQRGNSSHNHLPSRPPGLGNNRNSAGSSIGAQPPVVVTSKPAPPSPQQSFVHSRTKRLSQILATSSEVVLSVAIRRADRTEGDVQENQRPGVEDVSQIVRVEVQPQPDHLARPEKKEGPGQEVALERDGQEPQEQGVQELPSEHDEEPTVKTDAAMPRTFLPLPLYLSDPDRLSNLLQYLSFSDWCSLFNTSKEIRLMISQNELLREEVLERFLGEVGYSRWVWREAEPVMVSLTDMFYYIKGASIPIPIYAAVAERFLRSSIGDTNYPNLADEVLQLANATRAYNGLVLRLRAQSEMLDHCDTLSTAGSSRSTPTSRRSSSIPGSSSASFISSSPEAAQRRGSPAPSEAYATGSPLYRPNRAALLRVFVPSPNGDWLSDSSVLECEAELKRAGLTALMRLGDVVCDIALGDERGNMGKLIWDGCYLLVSFYPSLV